MQRAANCIRISNKVCASVNAVNLAHIAMVTYAQFPEKEETRIFIIRNSCCSVTSRFATSTSLAGTYTTLVSTARGVFDYHESYPIHIEAQESSGLVSASFLVQPFPKC